MHERHLGEKNPSFLSIAQLTISGLTAVAAFIIRCVGRELVALLNLKIDAIIVRVIGYEILWTLDGDHSGGFIDFKRHVIGFQIGIEHGFERIRDVLVGGFDLKGLGALALLHFENIGTVLFVKNRCTVIQVSNWDTDLWKTKNDDERVELKNE